MHIGLLLDLGDGGLLDVESRSDVRLSLASHVTQLAQALDFVLQLAEARVDPLMAFGRK